MRDGVSGPNIWERVVQFFPEGGRCPAVLRGWFDLLGADGWEDVGTGTHSHETYSRLATVK